MSISIFYSEQAENDTQGALNFYIRDVIADFYNVTF